MAYFSYMKVELHVLCIHAKFLGLLFENGDTEMYLDFLELCHFVLDNCKKLQDFINSLQEYVFRITGIFFFCCFLLLSLVGDT